MNRHAKMENENSEKLNVMDTSKVEFYQRLNNNVELKVIGETFSNLDIQSKKTNQVDEKSKDEDHEVNLNAREEVENLQPKDVKQIVEILEVFFNSLIEAVEPEEDYEIHDQSDMEMDNLTRV